MSVLDAMGYGLPIVSTNVGGIPRIVHNGENGFLCEPGDTDAMADGMAKLLCDRKFLKDMGEKSFETVKNGYSLESHIAALEKIYKSYCD